MSNVAIIPARGGSKRIPKKNIKEFNGKPIIGYSIESALESGCFDRVLVSTDDNEIKTVAMSFGAEVPFVRPTALADDITGTIPVIKHALAHLKQAGEEFDYACCIYATAPLIRVEYIKKGLQLIKRGKSDYVVPVTKYPFPIQRSLRHTSADTITMADQSNFNVRSQDLEEMFHDAGQFYWGSIRAWNTETPFFGAKTSPIFLPRDMVQDIDDYDDWLKAEWLYRFRSEKLK